MKKSRRFMSVLLCALLCIGMIIPAAADDAVLITSAAPAANPLDATDDEILLDFGAGDIATTGYIESFHPNCTYEFIDDGELGYTSIGMYNNDAKKYRLYFYTTAATREKLDINTTYYAAVTYKVNDVGELRMYLVNYSGDTQSVFTRKTTASDKWQTGTVQVNANLLEGIITGKYNDKKQRTILSWSTSGDWTMESGQEFLVKEVVFFTSADDAAAYAEAAPAYYNGETDDTSAEDAAAAEAAAAAAALKARKLRLLAMIVGGMSKTPAVEEESTTPAHPLDDIDDEILLDFGAGDILTTGCISLTHSSCTYEFIDDGEFGYTSIGKYNNDAKKYRFYFKTTDTFRQKLDTNITYHAAVTYKVNDVGELKMYLALSSGATQSIFTRKTTASDKWQTGTVQVDADLLEGIITGKYNNQNQFTVLSWSVGTDESWTMESGQEFLVKEVVFFTSAEDAAKYAAAALTYYNTLEASAN